MDRSKKIALGSIIGVLFSLIQIILVFWKTRLIIYSYGVDINSINAAATQLLGYVTLFEAGIGAGFLYKMYKPMAEKNEFEVNRLYNGLKKSMKRIATLMTGVLLVICVLYPLALANENFSYLRIMLILILLSARMLIPYAFSIHNRQMLILTEQQYIISFIDGIINLLFSVFEIFLIKYFNASYEAVLILGILFTGINSLLYYVAVMKSVKPLVTNTTECSFEGTKMTKDIIFHKLCYVANAQIDVFILSFLNLFKTTVYSTYNSIISYPTQIMNKIISNLRATMGLKLNSKDYASKSYPLFKEIISLNTFLASVVCCVFVILVNEFVTLWLGANFIVSQFSVILFAMILFNSMINESILIIRDGSGLYKESKKYTFATAVANLVFSVILVQKLGIDGLLIATVCCTYFIMDIGNNMLIFSKVFHCKMTIYFDYLISVFSIFIAYHAGNSIYKLVLNLFTNTNYITFAIAAAVVSSVVFLICFSLFFVANKYFRKIIKRIIKLVFKK